MTGTTTETVWYKSIPFTCLLLGPVFVLLWAVSGYTGFLSAYPPVVGGLVLTITLGIVLDRTGHEILAVFLSAITLFFMGIVVVFSLLSAEPFWSSVYDEVGSIAELLHFFVMVGWITVGEPLSLNARFVLEHPDPFVGSLGLVGVCATGLIGFAHRDIRSISMVTLVGKMVVLLVVLFILTVVMIVSFWHVVETPVGLVLFGVESNVPTYAITTLFVVGYLVGEFQRLRSFPDSVTQEYTSLAQNPAVDDIVQRIATQYDVPVPTVTIIDGQEPFVFTVGYRPTNTTLVIQSSVLDRLSERELEAVIAHELAHVANGDAMVMTIASLPMSLASRLKSQATTDPFGGADDFFGQFASNVWNRGLALFGLYLAIVAEFVVLFSRPFVAAVSQARERAADRAAVAVLGTPAPLASALRTLDTSRPSTPRRDLRNVSMLGIVPLEGNQQSAVFSSHPSVADRISAFADGDDLPPHLMESSRES
ncbi:M48 family metallopeptidase [Halocatena halophila]|uniref:M48 family metallopeptidase n=1 Tax=Halocatena halophila TaxID=2814576 RepID=UPI002ED053D1